MNVCKVVVRYELWVNVPVAIFFSTEDSGTFFVAFPHVCCLLKIFQSNALEKYLHFVLVN